MSENPRDCLIFCSDQHFGKKTLSYNPDKFDQSLEYLGQQIAKNRELHSGYTIDRCILFFLGDGPDGTGTYRTQPYHQSITSATEQTVEFARRTSTWIRRLKTHVFSEVEVHGVGGNHGAVSYYANETDNFDTGSYQHMKDILSPYDIPVYCGGHEFNVRKINVRGHNILGYHGHSKKRSNGNSIPWYNVAQKVQKWKGTKHAPFDVVAVGHFHTFGYWQMNDTHLLLNGTMVTDDEWARDELGWESINKWHMIYVSDINPIDQLFTLHTA